MEPFQTIDSTMEEILGLRSSQSQDTSSSTLNSGDILELLISEVQAYPILWNKAASEYKETPKKRLLWAEIANRLNVTVDLAKTKWKNLGDSFKKCLDRKREATKSGSGYKKPPTCHYYKQVVFMINKTKDK